MQLGSFPRSSEVHVTLGNFQLPKGTSHAITMFQAIQEQHLLIEVLGEEYEAGQGAPHKGMQG